MSNTCANISLEVVQNVCIELPYADVCADFTPTAHISMNVLHSSSIGPQGIPGTPGDAPVTFLAGQNLSAGRVVIIDSGAAWYFQPSDATHAGRAYGVTVTSASVGNDVDVKIIGQVTDAAFSFSTDSTLWVGADGEIFEIPQPGILQKAGISSASDTLKIDFSIQIITI